MPRLKSYNRSEVLEKAMHVFWKNGYEATTVRQLENELQINQFSIYAAFESKENLFKEALTCYKDFVSNYFLKKLIHSKGDLEDLRQFFLDFGKQVSSGNYPQGCLMVNTTMEVGDNKVVTEILKGYFDYVKELFEAFLLKAVKQKHLEADIDVKSKTLFLLGSLQGLAIFAKLSNADEIKTYVAAIMESISRKPAKNT